ncbi:ribosome recycling factor [Lujinxingia litoralis]|uniref:Ribosome-recycling factor n=1 Tax=Lujinxingia litoralis TaxID=2211119 RepID=A0A328C562_9DELT|nr:ribosome recycling factor [Lujinxingia litoralis]RAL20160.1 ribosome recycling factor [Lujinxingia litoralis]
MVQEVIDGLRSDYEQTLDKLRRELTKIRTGRANVNMLDGVRVDYYGSPSPLSQVATLRVPEPRLITIQPWEKNIISDIEKAIQMSDLGLNPSNDGTLIRVPIPALTGERRQELVKVARRTGEDHKIALRNQRRDANDMVKQLEKDSEITEDEMHKGYEKINSLTEEFANKIDAMLAKKEAEIVEV